MIDYTNKNYSKSPFYEEAVKRWAPFTGTNYELGVTISGRPVEIYALLGGQWPHSSYMVPGGVMCAPTLTDVTRAWSILEHFRRNWMEPIWLGCSLERYEEIKSYDDFLAWLDERPGARQFRPRPVLAHEHGYRPRQIRQRPRQICELGLPAARGQVQQADHRGPQRRASS